MTDIAERLRDRASNNAGHYVELDEALDREAADEIERLRRENSQIKREGASNAR